MEKKREDNVPKTLRRKLNIGQHEGNKTKTTTKNTTKNIKKNRW